MAEHSLVAAAAWVVALAVVVAHLADVLLLAELFHLVVADAEASADHSVVVLFLLADQLVVVAVAQLTKLFHVASTFLTVLKFRFLTKLLCLSLIHISEPTRPLYISYAVFCL